MFPLNNTPVIEGIILGLNLISYTGQTQNPFVIRDPNLLADERIWPLLVGEKLAFCAGDSVYREKLEEVRDGVICFHHGPFAYMSRRGLALPETDSVLVWLPLHEGGACLLVPTACVGGGMASFIPIFLVLDEYINRPEYPNTEATERFNFLVSIGLAGALTVAGGYCSWRYLRHAGESDYKTDLFLKRIGEAE